MKRTDSMLRVDWDGPCHTVPWVSRRLHRAGYRLTLLGLAVSPSGKGWHAWMRVKPVPRSKAEVVALQLLVGSDPKREARNLFRSRNGGPDGWWNVLYRR